MPSHALPTGFAGGRYQVKALLGEGGSKRVYLAYDARLEREVAVAVIRTEGLDEAGLARVRREAQAMARLGDHPHIVSIHDVGDEGVQPYIVSQYMAGGSLDDLLLRAETHRLPIAQVLRITDQICQALEHAHAQGIIHRDVKPSNVWLTRDGTAKLGDFGLAVALDRSRLTVDAVVVGTVAYMPPEQALGRPPDARSDLYSLGAMLYEMVTGRPPFVGDDAIAVIFQHINAAPVAPSRYNLEVPRALEALILQLLSKAADGRPESAAAVRDGLHGVSGAVTIGEEVIQREQNPLDRLARGVFVDRERELGELRSCLEDALSGRGRLALVAGEPGIGKTRTAEMVATYACLRGAKVLRGRCHEGEGAPPFWPWVQVIRTCVKDREVHAVLAELGPGSAYIAQLVPEVGERLPGLPTPVLESEQARFRLFDAITALLKDAARTRPLFIVLDDLHSADIPSLLFLRFLARELADSRVLVVGTYRDVGLGRQHPLSQVLAELLREEGGRLICLGGFSESNVARFMEMSVGQRPPADLVGAVFQETEGNPFFLTELVHLLAADGRLERPCSALPIPQSVREVIRQRVARLAAECSRVLTIAAVIGREFDLGVLERVADLAGERLLEAVEEALGARVLAEVPGSPGRYSFVHILIRETLYEELSAPRRVRLHRQIGEALESMYGTQATAHLAELAYHFVAAAPAGDVEKAIDYAQRAGDRAMALLAYEEAARQYELGLRAAELREPPAEGQRGELLLALGEACRRAGEFDKARETFRRAATLARRLGAADHLARAALGFAQWWQRTDVDELEVSLLEEALVALGEGDSPLRTRVMARLAVALHYYGGSRERRASLSLEAVETARRLGDRATLAYALNCRLLALWAPESAEERLASAAEILALAQDAGDAELGLESRQWRLMALLELGNMRAVNREMALYAEKAAELREPYFLWFSALWRAMRALLEGRFQEAERLAEQALAIGQRRNPVAAQAYAGQVAFVRWVQGRLDEVVPWVQVAAEQSSELPGSPPPAMMTGYRCALAGFYSELGQEADARREFERVAAHDFADIPHDVGWLVNVIQLAQACAFLKDSRRAAKLYEFLLPCGDRSVVSGRGVVCLGSAARSLGLLAATMGAWSQAEAHFEAALRVDARMAARPWLACTERDYAAMLLARDAPGDRERALVLLDRALQTGQELGMKRLVEQALALKASARGLVGGDPRSSIDIVASAVPRERPDLRGCSAPDGTVTILFTDIEGCSALTSRLGDVRAQEVLRSHNAIVRREVAAHGGLEVKSQGDGFMLAFASGAQALRCAIAAQRAFAAHGAERPDVAIRVRIGIHTGEAIREANDFFGKTVIVAARIAHEAQGGEILVSSMVRELAESTGQFAFDSGRDVELKGIAGTHRLFAVRW